MRKMFYLLFLFCLRITAQEVNYQIDDSVISNPEKGFYHYTSTGSSGGYNLLSQSTLIGYRTNENITVIQRQFFLRDFISGVPISSTYLTNMQTDFNRIRNAGAKVIVRFTYSSSSSTPIFQPTKSQIINHIAQLAPVVNANRDVIVSIQAGFIGKYGEWYYTGSSEFGDGNYNLYTTTQWNNRKDVINAMLNSFSSELPIQVRYIIAKQKMYGNSFIGRIGFYNDSFLGTYGDSGTFNVDSPQGQPISTEIKYWQRNTVNNPVTGETNMINNPRTNCSNAMLEMDRFNWSLINKDYFPNVISDWQNNDCFTTMQKNLGYNFRLNNAKLSNGILTISIGNYGYANVFKNRKIFIVCKNISTNVNYSFIIHNNLSKINSNNIDLTINLNTQQLPNGQYKLFLNLPDQNLSNNINYSIRCSNLNVWTNEGFNDLFLTYTKTSPVFKTKYYDIYGNYVGDDKTKLSKGIYIKKEITNETVTTNKIWLD